MSSEHPPTSEETHFGFQSVSAADKARRVGEVFESVAQRYDLMNDLMSFGLHRLWKQQALRLAGLRRGHQVLDLAAGTGDLSRSIANEVGPGGFVVACDISPSMLTLGRDRLTDAGIVGNIGYAIADAERLPFPDQSFERVTIGFGLRNVTRKARALEAMRRVLLPAGRVVILEFSSLYVTSLRPLYDLYSLRYLPLLGRLVARDQDSYRYLAESIRLHPDQESLKAMMEAAGFEDCDYVNLCGGLVAVHRGHVY